MTVSATIKAGVSVTQTRAAIAGVSPQWANAFSETLSLSNGTGANQADIAYFAEHTVASNANDDIDLAGVLTDAFGATITAAKLVYVGFINKQMDGTANSTNLTPGGGSNTVPGFSAALWPISPGGVFSVGSPGAAGLAAVTAGTGDILRIANSSGAQAKYVICILARSA